MFPRAVRVATIGGVDVRVDPSWVIILVVIVAVYRTAFVSPDRSTAVALGLAAATAVLFGLSVLVHELAHALEGTHRGAEVAGITLFVLGGATALRGGDRRARDEFAIAAIGPWSNVVLAALAGLVATGARGVGLDGVADVAGVIGWLNLGLALFNLVPGAPLDGGRVLRAGVWAMTGDRHRATVIAAWAGIVLAATLFAGAAWALGGGPGGLWGALWTAAIAAYVLRASITERSRGRLGRWLARRRAGDLAPAAPTVGPDAPAGAAAQLLDDTHRAVLVDDGGPVGLVPGDALRGADPATPVGTLMAPLDHLPRVAAASPADELSNLLDREQPFLLVTPDGSGDLGGAVSLSSLHAIDRAVRHAMREERT